MVFCIVYTPLQPEGSAGAGIELFGDWRPPLAFSEHWRFAAGGGIGLVEAQTVAELSRALSPFAPFFAFQVARVEEDAGRSGLQQARPAAAGLLPVA
jgi:hypothetical protein